MPLEVLSRARFLLLFVQQSITVAISQAQGTMVSIPETTLLAWQTLLMTVVNQLNALPVPAIFPAPRWAQLVGMATGNITSALELLAGIPVVQLRIFPPQPGQGTTSVETLRRVQANLTLAINAIEAAERELAG